MALILHSSPCSYLLSKKSLLLLHSPTKSALLSIKSQDTSSSSSPSSQSSKPTSPSNGDGSSSVLGPPLNKPISSQGQGFGSSSPSPSKPKPSPVSTKKKQKGKRERASVIRRAPVETPQFVSRQEEARASEQIKNESAFLLAWLGLGGVILVEGIALAASGFLPEEWDKFFVKYLYPLFTPTVFLFVAGTVAYGVLKYLQNEKLKNKN